MGYISKIQREEIKQKFGGLKDDWQVEHIKSLVRNWFDGTSMFPDAHRDENLVPVSLDLETFRTWYLGGLHERLKKLPKNPKAEKSIKRKAYLLEVAQLFGIEIDKPLWRIEPYFDGINTAVTTYKVVDQNGTLQYMGDRNQCEYFLQYGC